MQLTSSRDATVLRVAAACVAVAGCSTAASVIFDAPQKPQDATSQPARAAGVEATLPADTVRPPAELTLDTGEVLRLLPRDAGGHIDWVGALREGVIDPRRSLPGQEPPPALDGFRFDFKLAGPAPMFDAAFPHSSHVEWLSCESCHGRIFEYRNATITMEAVNDGEACGVCHRTVAFPATACYRCHEAMPASGTQSPQLVTDVTLTRRADTSSAAAERTGDYPPARFAHWVHRIRYRCSACHPSLFEARAGASELTMADLNAGRACGACHNGDTAFGVLSCGRCHVPPEPG